MKWVKAGKSTMEGCLMMVLRIPRCQDEMRPRNKPGRNIRTKIVAATSILSSVPKIPNSNSENGEASAIAFPRREKRQAANMSRNLVKIDQGYQN